MRRFATRNRYDYDRPLTVVTCPGCGLCFINPQYALSDYASFYQNEYFEDLQGQTLDQIIASVQDGYRAAFFEFFRAFAAELPEGGSYLDAGAGTGIFLSFLREVNPSIFPSQVHVLEPSSATGVHITERFPGVSIQQEMVETNRYESGTFDAVLCSALIEHFIDPLQALLHLNRIMKLGGRMMLLTPKLDEHAVVRGVHAFFKFVHTFYYTSQSLESLLKKAGFEVEIATEYSGVRDPIWYNTLLVTVRKTHDRTPDDAQTYATVTALDRENVVYTDRLMRVLKYKETARRVEFLAKKTIYDGMVSIRSALTGTARAKLRVQLDQQVQRRRAALSRPLRIARGLPEYLSRTGAARRLDPANALSTSALQRDGYEVLTLPDDVLGPLLEASATKLARALEGEAQQCRKTFFSSLMEPQDFDVDSPFMKLALDTRVLATVGRYLGCAPYLESVDMLYSRPTDGEALSSSQLWHEDMTEKALLKLFVYITDVGDESGPFTLLSRADSARVPGFLSHYVDDATMRRYVGDEAIRYLKGPAGTSFFVDTRNCYHRGSRCKQPRLAFVCYYTSGFGYYDRMRSWSRPASNLNRIQRLALGYGD